jgi:hypothetical protein
MPQVAVEGKLCNRSYINKEGIKVHRTEIHLRELLILEHGKQPSLSAPEEIT